MKKILTFVALWAFLSPIIVGAFASHDVKHSIHNTFETSSQYASHDHTQHSHVKGVQVNNKSHHLIVLDLFTNLKSNFHSSLINTKLKLSNKVNKLKTISIEYFANLLANIYHFNILESDKRNIILAYKKPELSEQSLYLNTQRLRI